MKFSELPDLRDYRDDLAEGFGGDRLAALTRANRVCKRIYSRAIASTGKPRNG